MSLSKFDWAGHRYGASWWRYYDGAPHPDDDLDYYWTGSSWAPDWDYMNAMDERDETRTQRSSY